ncbi:MAG TPA: dienelactone hydrolase family protein [Acidobacteriota bacterium]|jgi:pimeloyl-ACP methyl ester carboxylesterase
MRGTKNGVQMRDVQIPSSSIRLEGELHLVEGSQGIVLFAHGSGSSRHSPRNQYVAEVLHNHVLSTLLFDLLTPSEESIDIYTRQYRFDIGLLTTRLVSSTEWVIREPATRGLRVGYFGASTGAAAALAAAACLGSQVGAVVSRGGRPDLAGQALRQVVSPTLLIVGGHDHDVIELNEEAFQQLECEKKMEIIPGASHLFEEPGALEKVAQLAAAWFEQHLTTSA